MRAGRRAIVVAALVALGLTTAGQGPASGTHTSGVTSVDGLAFNYYVNVGLFGGPSTVRGYGQDASAPASGASPSVECPAGGGTDSRTDPDGAIGQYGPASIFSGQWPENLSSAPPSGPLTSTIDCQLGQNGYVTATTSVTLPRGAGPGPFIADEVHSTCTVNADGTSTMSTTIINGILETKYDPVSQLPVQSEPIPKNPPINYTRTGTIDHVGDHYRIVFNEQTENPDGSVTVNAAHMYLLGPVAVGDMVVGSSTCGPLTIGPLEHRDQPADFDGDGDTDVSVFRSSTGIWFVQGGQTETWGTQGDIPVPGDYDGDGDTDVAVFRPSNGVWFVQGGPTVAWGAEGDIPVPGDYDGDGDTDMAVFRPSTGTWFVQGGPSVAWGTAGDIPVPGDYDGDGDTDVAVFRPSAGVWFVQGGATTAWGTSGDIPVPGDYDGDGDTDMAVFRTSTGIWFVEGGPTTAWGTEGDIPVPGDYDGDGTIDIAVFRPSSGIWFVEGGATTAWGTTGDLPLPLPAAIRGV